MLGQRWRTGLEDHERINEAAAAQFVRLAKVLQDTDAGSGHEVRSLRVPPPATEKYLEIRSDSGVQHEARMRSMDCLA